VHSAEIHFHRKISRHQSFGRFICMHIHKHKYILIRYNNVDYYDVGGALQLDACVMMIYDLNTLARDLIALGPALCLECTNTLLFWTHTIMTGEPWYLSWRKARWVIYCRSYPLWVIFSLIQLHAASSMCSPRFMYFAKAISSSAINF